jgi:mannosyl-oligosaccharide alpha-1,2-mannosidase
MYVQWCGLAVMGLVALANSLPSNSKRQTDFTIPPAYSPNLSRANAVKEAFQRSWNGYYKFAFPHDSLKPISNSWDDDRSVFRIHGSVAGDISSD